jgi:predicted ArsR family transcriptional regulator
MPTRTKSPSTTPPPGEGAPSTRRRVLELLREDGGPLTVDEMARLTDLHANTVRAHLQLLVDMGQVEREIEQRSGPGRPHVLYRIGTEDAGANPYQLLATELAAGIAASGGDTAEGAAGQAAGRHWARTLRSRHPVPSDPVSADAAIQLAAEGLNELGFATETEPLGDRLYLRSCPFAELARHNVGVCHMHRDLLNGLFAELGVEVAVESLDIFVRADLCVAHLRRPDLDHNPSPGATS